MKRCCFVIFISFLIHFQTQSQTFEGEIKYRFEIHSLTENKNVENVLRIIQPEYFSYYIKQNKLRSYSAVKGDEKKEMPQYTLWSNGKQYGIDNEKKTILTSKSKDDLKKFQDLVQTDSTKSILNHTCKLYYKRLSEGVIFYWIAADLQVGVSDGHGLVIMGKGICLEYLFENDQVEYSFKAIEIIPKEIKSGLFSIPSDYEITEMEMPKGSVFQVIEEYTPDGKNREIKKK